MLGSLERLVDNVGALEWPRTFDLGGIESLVSSRAGQVVIGATTSAILGIAIASTALAVVALMAVVFSLIAMAFALVHPGRVFFALVLVLALVPIYAAPEFGSLLFVPAAGMAWLLAGMLAWRNFLIEGRLFKVTGVDITVGTFALLMAVSLAFSHQTKQSDYLNDVFVWTGPYLAARFLLRDTRNPVFWVAAAFACVTVLIAPIAILEVTTHSNPFLSFQFNSSASAVWAVTASRFGQIRAEASFGHPIALSMFVSISAVLSLSMALYAKRLRERNIWFGLAAAAIGVQALTYSRTGWLIVVIGIAILGATAARGVARRRVLAVLAVTGTVIASLLLFIAPPKELQLLSSSSNASVGGAAFQDSGAYRQALLDRALQPGVLHLWGNPVNLVTPAVSSTNQATDNAYIILADQWGLLPTFALIMVGVAAIVVAIKARLDRREAMVVLPLVAFTSLVGLFFVAFITQQQLMIWLLVGSAGVIAERLSNLRSISNEDI